MAQPYSCVRKISLFFRKTRDHRLTAMTICSIRVWAAIDTAAGVRADLLVPPASQQNQDGGDHSQHEYQASNADANGETAL